MDRAGTLEWTMPEEARRGVAEEYVLPTRAKALAVLLAALTSCDGPLLLTGEAGVGKSWLCRRVQAAMPVCWRWVEIDLSPAVGPTELYRLILHGLGQSHGGGLGEARAVLEDLIGEAAADGARSGLIVDEAHCGSLEVLEELRVLASRMGRPEAFAGLFLVGQTVLARRLATRPLAALQSRLAARVHLRALGVDELHAWLGRLEPGHGAAGADLERIHRAVAGNPRQLALLTGRHPEAIAPRGESISRPSAPLPTQKAVLDARAPAAARVTAAGVAPGIEVPALVPVKPPLRVDEGMIEVGWDESADDPTETPTTEGIPEARDESGREDAAAAGTTSEELVDDRYAALQAWTEWAQNEARKPVDVAEISTPPQPSPTEPSVDAETDEPGEAPAGSPAEGRPSVWAEGQHAFAPYSQLFSRLRLSRDAQ